MARIVLYLLLLLASSLSAGDGLDRATPTELNQCCISLDQSDADVELSFDDLDQALTASYLQLAPRATSPSVFTSFAFLVLAHANCHLIRAPPRSLA